MSITAIIPNSTTDFILESQRGEESPIVWKLKTLTAKEDALVEEALLRFRDTQSMGVVESLALGFALVGVENFLYPDGTAFVLERTAEGLSEKSLNSIPKAVRREIMTAVISGGQLTEGEQKN